MVRTEPTGRGTEIREISPDACPDCGQQPMWPYWASCDSTVESGHRYWSCPGCGLRLIDADCNCTTPGRRWPDHAAAAPDVVDS
jgi:predicted RNA-binding Zn-ribbon protein involved in translation (DUF1610 family)